MTTISRRGFLGAASLFLLAPKLLIHKSIDLHRYLAGFCMTESDRCTSRYDLTAPLFHDGRGYGTDGRAIVRIASGEPATDKAKIKVPDCAGVYRKLWKESGRWFPVPKFRVEDLQPHWGDCPLCEPKECPECDGEGFTFFCRGQCGTCGGHGTTAKKNCPLCHGCGSSQNMPSVLPIGDKLIGWRYLKKLNEIPGCHINVGRHCECDPFLFRSDLGIEGLVMPVAP